MHKTASVLCNRRKKCSQINDKDQIKSVQFSKQKFLVNVISDKYTNKKKSPAFLETGCIWDTQVSGKKFFEDLFLDQ